MNLERAAQNAIDLSHRMEAALKIDDMDLCKDLLALRGEAMVAFGQWHSASSASEKNICQPLIDELITADGNLKVQYKAALEESAVVFRQSLTSSAGIPAGAYNTNTTPACVDRKA